MPMIVAGWLRPPDGKVVPPPTNDPHGPPAILGSRRPCPSHRPSAPGLAPRSRLERRGRPGGSREQLLAQRARGRALRGQRAHTTAVPQPPAAAAPVHSRSCSRDRHVPRPPSCLPPSSQCVIEWPWPAQTREPPNQGVRVPPTACPNRPPFPTRIRH